MRGKTWLKYLIYTSIIIAVVFVGQNVFEQIRMNAIKTFNFYPYLQNVVSVIVYGSVGFILGFDSLMCEIKKEGKWKVNLPKMVFMGIPALYFSFSIFIYYSNIRLISEVLVYPARILVESNPNLFSVFQLMLGYSIATIFYKDTENMHV